MTTTTGSIIAGSAPDTDSLLFQASPTILGITEDDKDKVYHTTTTNQLFLYRGGGLFAELLLGPQIGFGDISDNFVVDNSGNNLITDLNIIIGI